MIKKTVAFNPDDPHQMRILQWVESQTNNFSGFTKDMYFAMMQGGAARPPVIPQPVATVPDSDDHAFMDIL